MRCYNAGRTNDEQLKIELLSQWKLEAEFRNIVSIPEIKKKILVFVSMQENRKTIT